jgi:Tannase and feruloyl esterase
VPSDPDHNILLALQRWVDQGIAPERIIATKYKSDNPADAVEMTRPLCPFPKVARDLSPTSLQSEVESAVDVALIFGLFLCSAKVGRFSAPAIFRIAVARSLGQAWPQATGEAGAERA